MSGCFIYLVNHTTQAVADGMKSLALLERNYLKQFPATVILFHEDGLSDAMRTMLAAQAASATFVQVDFSSYPTGDGPGRLGYRHMCRFFAGEVFKHPALDGFDYCCRLDTDSFVLSPIGYDMFEFMRATGAWYGFLNDELQENPRYYRGLWATATGLVDVGQVRAGGLYYTNFEICYIPWFRGEAWQSFFAGIDKAGGIYAHRWGDHTIRYLGVKALMHPARVRRLEGIDYLHQGIGANHAS